MRLGLLSRPKPFEDERGVIRMHALEMVVIDLDTGAELENQSGMIWCEGSTLCDGEGALFTPEHVDREKEYLVIVVECEGAVTLGRGETYKP